MGEPLLYKAIPISKIHPMILVIKKRNPGKVLTAMPEIKVIARVRDQRNTQPTNPLCYFSGMHYRNGPTKNGQAECSRINIIKGMIYGKAILQDEFDYRASFWSRMGMVQENG